MVTTKPTYRFQYQMDTDIHRNKKFQGIFLKWIKSRPVFKHRKPTVKETVDEMRNGCLKALVEQDVKKAAEKYWYSEAQYYLRHITVVKIDIYTKKPVSRPVKAYVPIGSKDRNGHIPNHSYVPSTRIIQDPVQAYTVLERAKNEFENWKARYEDYAEFFEVFQPVLDAFEEARNKLNRTITKQRKSVG